MTALSLRIEKAMSLLKEKKKVGTEGRGEGAIEMEGLGRCIVST